MFRLINFSVRDSRERGQSRVEERSLCVQTGPKVQPPAASPSKAGEKKTSSFSYVHKKTKKARAKIAERLPQQCPGPSASICCNVHTALPPPRSSERLTCGGQVVSLIPALLQDQRPPSPLPALLQRRSLILCL